MTFKNKAVALAATAVVALGAALAASATTAMTSSDRHLAGNIMGNSQPVDTLP
ncbi:hypothetical protein DFJ67_7160 [Asanoa ferruginea]|uniref:Small secreted domain DUF320 n=1 Tax=Asanoa ferruginea TaxID=53367 RepID=A0A3D9ZWW2_9ACTN|nr:hypothetical protein [Asanoa ferruginea]REG01085.1 hypothetical protein DFJ67_7160 [Asanoa ferruginea]GIF47216.1 hypothetical protein Afe04nite_17550 [Asanoa ferruginea]